MFLIYYIYIYFFLAFELLKAFVHIGSDDESDFLFRKDSFLLHIRTMLNKKIFPSLFRVPYFFTNLYIKFFFSYSRAEMKIIFIYYLAL